MEQISEATQLRLHDGLSSLYGADRASDALNKLLQVLEAHCRQRTMQRSRTLWDQRDAILITYPDVLHRPGHRPMDSLRAFLEEHVTGAFSIVHVLPFFPSSSDDGFSVIDHRQVDSDLGTWGDVAALSANFDLMVDLVMNHVSRESLWFADFRENILPGREYFIDVDPRTKLLSRVVRPRSTPLLSDVYTRRGRRFVWATFGSDQIDLNYQNPDVLLELTDIMLAYIRSGVRVLRLGAVAYLWKEIGTTCVHLPQTHEIVRLLRTLLDELEPGCALLTETDVPHEKNVSYFGQGDEAHAVYQFTLPPLLLHALFHESTAALKDWAEGLAPPPPGCAFVNFTACHDGVGLRALESIVPEAERRLLVEAMQARGGFISTKRDADGFESPYEAHISYFDACADPSSCPDLLHLQRFMLSQLVPLCLRGIPAVYIHSLFATPNDRIGVERREHTRAINRRRWDWGELRYIIANPKSDASRALAGIVDALLRRRQHPAFHPDAPQQILDVGDEVFAVRRTSPDGSQTIVALHNFTPRVATVPLASAVVPDGDGAGSIGLNLLTDQTVSYRAGKLELPPYAVCWLSRAPID